MFKQDFREFIMNRCQSVPTGMYPEQRQLNTEITELQKKILSLLGPQKKLIGNYEAITTQLEALSIQESYKIGLRDGLELRRELELAD